jgi:hypothetical protein
MIAMWRANFSRFQGSVEHVKVVGLVETRHHLYRYPENRDPFIQSHASEVCEPGYVVHGRRLLRLSFLIVNQIFILSTPIWCFRGMKREERVAFRPHMTCWGGVAGSKIVLMAEQNRVSVSDLKRGTRIRKGSTAETRKGTVEARVGTARTGSGD